MIKFNSDALKGFIKDNAKKIGLSLEDYMKASAMCGCGIDCCDNTIHLNDKETGVPYVLYISDGQIVTETYSQYRNPSTGETGGTGEPDGLTPDPININDMIGYNYTSSNSQRITGIDTSITLKIEWTGDYTYTENEAMFTLMFSPYDPPDDSRQITYSGQEITIPKDWYIIFIAEPTNNQDIDMSVTIKNASDGDAILDTFDVLVTKP